MSNEMLVEMCKANLEKLTTRARSYHDAGNAEKAAELLPEIREARIAYDMEVERREWERRAESVPAPMGAPEERGVGVWPEIRKAMIEKRAITANGAGVGTVSDVVTALVDGGKLRPKVAVFTAANARSVVPVFAPGLALPAGQAPGATSVSSDSTAVLTGKELALKAWMSILPIATDALISTSIAAKLPKIFADAFGGAVDKGILVGTGSGNDMLGVFVASASGVTTSQDIPCAASGAPKWVDLIKLAGQIIGIGGDLSRAAIAMHPDLVANLLSEATTATEGLKMELLTRGTIRGIPVVESSYCPTTLSAGSYVAVGGYFDLYALAVAREIVIDPIKTVGYDGTTYQATAYLQGSPMIGSAFRRLKTV